ncbi:MAG: hypothetical protein H6642_15785 [Caldilineaceae bacterium]|nr:hypothetical protein [Caldilineaceae bacterium]
MRATDRTIVAIDLETTGLHPVRDRIIEIGAVRMQGGEIRARFSTLINPGRTIPLQIQQITGIRNEDVAHAPRLEEAAPALRAFVDDTGDGPVSALVAHNASFDFGFLDAAGIHLHRPILDTYELATILLPGMTSYNLGELCRALAISLVDAHRALDDAAASALLFQQLRTRLDELPPQVINAILAYGRRTEWPPLQLFEDAANERGLERTARPRTDLTLPRPQNAAALIDHAPLNAHRGAPVAADPARLDDLLGEDGALARQLGPQYEARPGQLRMAHLVLDALNRGDHLLIEAGTGVGKSLAYLAPAALWSLLNQRRVIIATYTRTLQEQLVHKDLPQLHDLLRDQALGDLTWTQLKGRGNYLCTRRLEQWAGNRDLPAHELSFLAKILVWMSETADGDMSDLHLPTAEDRALWAEIASHSASCTPERCSSRPGWRDYYWLARARAERVHCLVINHALLMANVAADGRLLPPVDHLIVDEAHHLEDAATDQLTYRVDWERTQRQLARLTPAGDLLPGLLTLLRSQSDNRSLETAEEIEQQAARAGSALRRFAAYLAQSVLTHQHVKRESDYAQRIAIDSRLRSQPLWSEVEIEWDSVIPRIDDLLKTHQRLLQRLIAGEWMRREPQAMLLDELQGVYEEIADLQSNMATIIFGAGESSHGDSVAWLEVESQRGYGDRRDADPRVTLLAAPLHVGRQVEASLIRASRASIFTGATLRTADDFTYIRERLGLWDATESTVGSPFDYARNVVLLLPRNLPAPNQAGYQAGVEEAILAAARAAAGRTLVLFTSYAQLRTTADALRAPLDQLGIRLLQHGMSSRSRLLREFSTTERAVLMGTRSFWEGIDLPGDQLSVLIIVRLPFAVPSDPLIAARSAEFDNAFRDFTVPDAILRFRQGFGRLIRRQSDRGAVLLLDSRLWQKSYGQMFLDALPECERRFTRLENVEEEVRAWLTPEVNL